MSSPPLSAALVWPAREKRIAPSGRLLELSYGLADVRLLRTLERATAEAETFARTAIPAEEPRLNQTSEGALPITTGRQSERQRILAEMSAARIVLQSSRTSVTRGGHQLRGTTE